ncbi:MAG TPA: serine kinase [Bacteroidales bacterium]|nr:serine kinase [Bacteroidales bacterium]
MKVIDLVNELGLQVFSGKEGLNNEVTGGYTSDLLSDVMGHAETGSIWITIQTHKNVMAIASLKDLPAVVITSGEQPGEETVAESNAENIPVLGTPMRSFEVSGKIFNILAKK